MYSYSISQWLLFFFIYCFLGWVWESCYVSLENKKWTNRGFMKGPFLPIYGSGAMIILIATIPLEEHIVLVFFAGMIAASALEYVTGAAMEAMFKVRYWDYSNQPFNLNGHICLMCSLVWGAFSILMVKVIHVPIEKVVLSIPDNIEQIITLVLAVLIAADFTESFRDAIDLKNVLVSMTENNEEIIRMRKRLDVIIAFVDDDKKEFQRKLDDKAASLKNSKEEFANNIKDIKERFEFLENSNKNDTGIREKLEQFMNELEEIKLKCTKESQSATYRREVSAKRYNRLLNRHPSAVSKKFSQALDEIKSYASGQK